MDTVDTALLGTLKHHREWVALEAEHDDTPSNTRDLVERFLPDVRRHFTNFMDRFSAKDAGIELTRNQRDFIKVVERVKYLDLAPCAAYVPEGLNVTYLHYLNILGPVVEHAVKVEALLNTYTTYLAMLVTNHDERFSTRDSAVRFKNLENERIGLLKDLGSCFKQGSHNTDVNYGAVVDRNNEWPHVFQQAGKLTDELNKVNRTALNKNLAHCVQMVDKVIALVSHASFEGAAPNMVLELSDGAFQVASELEYFATCYYRMMALTTSIDRTTEHVKKIYTDIAQAA